MGIFIIYNLIVIPLVSQKISFDFIFVSFVPFRYYADTLHGIQNPISFFRKLCIISHNNKQ